MSRKIIWKWLQIPIFLAGIVLIIGAPFGLSQIESPLWKTLAWVLCLMVIAIIAICVGLTPYWGQKAITDEQKANYEMTTNSADEDRWKAHRRIEELEQEVRRLKGGSDAET